MIGSADGRGMSPARRLACSDSYAGRRWKIETEIAAALPRPHLADGRAVGGADLGSALPTVSAAAGVQCGTAIPVEIR